MKLKKFLSLEWDAIAGIVAAVVAIILHLLHVVDEHVIMPIVLALIALLFINFMRHTRNNELTAEQVNHTAHTVSRIQSELKPADVILVGPRHLRTANESFVRHMSGDTVWFNVCLSMYKSQPLFDSLLRSAIDNPMVTSIQFILDESQKDLWLKTIQPRIATCTGNAKVKDPRWQKLNKTVSFIIADNQLNEGAEALLSFWGEPFMAQSTERNVPRFIFHVQRNSELLPHLMELAHSCLRLWQDKE
ncbi:MAG TPA: hypothetical protein PLW69_01435 [Agitococcus sp.]|nr:hypothetical protein [Moraxellaceae bacterium]HQV79607.1 hypothetical protein [Agitococcus sp.]